MTKNLTTNVLIFIYLIFFLIPDHVVNPAWFVVGGTTKDQAGLTTGGAGGGARLDTFEVTFLKNAE